MTVKQALIQAIASLKRHGCPETHPDREAVFLLSEATGLTPERIAAEPERDMSDGERDGLERLIGRRLRHEPIEMIAGWASFRGLRLAVTPDTLIPRPSTEMLVDEVLAGIDRSARNLIVDVGTGTGAIALSLARELPDARIVAVDVSRRALETAMDNCPEWTFPDRRPNTRNRLSFLEGDLLEPAIPFVKKHDGPVTVVANLPYIPEGRWKSLPPEIRDYEPKKALVSGPDGLDHYRRLIRQMAEIKIVNLAAYLEILPEQQEPLTETVAHRLPELTVTPIKNGHGLTYALKALGSDPIRG
ncbi:peptide chain release factor N(5)-glutamine methyltransferase [Candidatus Uhrbacteria bacterium]|nr:peptide chain release factor N(5)-glutamine methyltransferase [Candidatus Uhrbacteria bacterium]